MTTVQQVIAISSACSTGKAYTAEFLVRPCTWRHCQAQLETKKDKKNSSSLKMRRGRKNLR